MNDNDLQKRSFKASLSVVNPTENEIEEAKASLDTLKTLLPSDIIPEDDPDLLYVAANLAVAGLVNANDDGLDTHTAIDVYKKFAKKQVNIEHNRKSIVGFILHVGLSEFGTNRILTEEEALESGEPFNITTVSVLWKVANQKLCDAIIEASNPSHSDYNKYSLSFEMAFKEFAIAVLPKDTKLIKNAVKTVTLNDEDFSEYKKCLRAYGGDGVCPGNKDFRIYRILGSDALPVGEGIVETPAAQVRGIDVIDEPTTENHMDEETETESETKIEIDVKEDEVEVEIKTPSYAVEKHLFACFVKSLEERLKNSVSDNIAQNIKFNTVMDNTKLNELKEKIAIAEKIEDFKEIAVASHSLADVIAKESERLASEKKEAEELAANLEKAKQEAEAANATLKTELEALKEEVSALRQAQIEAEATAKFNERMGAIDSEFEFNDEEKEYIVEEIRSLDDESFAKWMDKSKKMLKEKTKAYKAEVKKKAEDEKKAVQEKMCAALKEKGVTIKISDTEDLNVEEVIASAKENREDADIYNGISVSKSLQQKVQEAFAGVKIGGKAVKELSKNK